MEKNSEKNEEKTEFTITTYDNPWNPWTHFDEWEAFDLFYGYKTWQKVAAISMNSVETSEKEDEDATNFAIDELCALMPAVYTRIYKPA